MEYANIVQGIFLGRPNRFLAEVLIEGKPEMAHVKNTGRCKELLITGVAVYLQIHDDIKRKTKYSLIAVMKGSLLINMDSQAPNKIWHEALEEGIIFNELGVIQTIKREVSFGNSRLDFYVESSYRKAYMEVKGVTLENDGAVFFPDAPTERGIKHIRELSRVIEADFLAYIVFIIQMSGVKYISPNDTTHPQFGAALRAAAVAGLKILAYDCNVTPQRISIGRAVPVVL